jgi:hypothetical protein
MTIGFFLKIRERREGDKFGLIKETEDKEMIDF